LQKLPKTGGTESKVEDETEAWNRAVTLGSTLKPQELLDTDINTLLHRLFWEETIRVFDPLHPSFQCNCSREKVGNMLKMLGQDEVNTAVNELGRLDINCDFCGKHYGFDRVDCAQLFVAATLVEATTTASDSKH
jgi:molecular chaperone Hsp33